MGVLTEAMNPIKALAKQARSYSGSVAKAGIRASSGITRDALRHGLTYYAAGGAIAGGGVGFLDAQENGGSRLRSTLKGAAYGAAGGAALRVGMSAMGPTGRRGINALGKRIMGGVGGGMSGKAAAAAGSTNYFRAMAGDFERAGGFASMRAGVRGAYGQASRYATGPGRRAVNSVMRSGAAGKVAEMAGKAVGRARGYAGTYGREAAMGVKSAYKSAMSYGREAMDYGWTNMQ